MRQQPPAGDGYSDSLSSFAFRIWGFLLLPSKAQSFSLSAKLLTPTIPEEKGWVKREDYRKLELKVAQLEAELETLQKLDEIGAAGLAVENTRLEAENDRLRETIGDPIKVRLFAEHILEDPPLYIEEASELLMRIANALKAGDDDEMQIS